jgi:hypothetical protein
VTTLGHQGDKKESVNVHSLTAVSEAQIDVRHFRERTKEEPEI